MEFKAVCEICGKDYDNYMRTFKLKVRNSVKTLCHDCFKTELKRIEQSDKFWFYPHIPGFCEGCDLQLEVFDSLAELSKKLKEFKQYGTLATDDADNPPTFVMTVEDNGEHWWVHGYSNGAKALNLPDWRTLKK